MKNAAELTKEYLAELIRTNPTAALEYTWGIRDTLSACNKRRMKVDHALRNLIYALRNAELDDAEAKALADTIETLGGE